MRKALLLGLAVLQAGCAAKVMQFAVAPSDVPVASAALTAGSGTVTGSALIRQGGGGVVTCAGNDVHLIPATESTSREMIRVFGGEKGYVRRGGYSGYGGTLVTPPEPNRRGQCNAQGGFTFTEVKAGRWHVMTTVTWVVGSEYQGGTLLGTAEVRDGGTVEVVLSP